MRLRADIWVAAYIRRCEIDGVFAVLRRRGAAEAGAIFIKLDRLDGRAALYAPAPQSELAEMAEQGIERLWRRAHKDDWVEPAQVESRLQNEIRFDPDLWIIDVEDRAGLARLDLAPD
jgi:hypothetical protein